MEFENIIQYRHVQPTQAGFASRSPRLMKFEKIIRYRPMEPAKAGFAAGARGFSRRATRRIAEYLIQTPSAVGHKANVGLCCECSLVRSSKDA